MEVFLSEEKNYAKVRTMQSRGCKEMSRADLLELIEDLHLGLSMIANGEAMQPLRKFAQTVLDRADEKVVGYM